MRWQRVQCHPTDRYCGLGNGVSKTRQLLPVLVKEYGTKILEYEIKLGGKTEFRVGVETETSHPAV